jgi:transposase-like protein
VKAEIHDFVMVSCFYDEGLRLIWRFLKIEVGNLSGQFFPESIARDRLISSAIDLLFLSRESVGVEEIEESLLLMVLVPVHCPDCDGTQNIKHGKTPEGKQHYCCQDQECKRSTFICEYSDARLLPQVKQQICDMAINGSGIRDTAQVLGVSQKTVIETLKKKSRVENSQ